MAQIFILREFLTFLLASVVGGKFSHSIETKMLKRSDNIWWTFLLWLPVRFCPFLSVSVRFSVRPFLALVHLCLFHSFYPYPHCFSSFCSSLPLLFFFLFFSPLFLKIYCSFFFSLFVLFTNFFFPVDIFPFFLFSCSFFPSVFRIPHSYLLLFLLPLLYLIFFPSHCLLLSLTVCFFFSSLLVLPGCFFFLVCLSVTLLFPDLECSLS